MIVAVRGAADYGVREVFPGPLPAVHATLDPPTPVIRSPAVLAAGALLLALPSIHTECAAQGTSFREPPEVRSRGGVLADTLVLRVTPTQLGSRTIHTATYNGSLPGPTWRVRGGDTLRFRLVNDLVESGTPPAPPRLVDCGSPAHARGRLIGASHAEGAEGDVSTLTNLHTHGLQVSPVGNGDNPFIDLAPGEACDYEIPIPADQPPGLHWYHPHRHGSTSKQGWAGLAGAIIVEGGLDDVPEIAGLTTRTLILQELWLDGGGRVPPSMALPSAGATPFTTLDAVPSTFTYTVNGLVAPDVPARPGEPQRWRILNASPHRAYLLRLDGHGFFQIAQDGIAFDRARPRQEILMAPGNRVEVVVVPGAPGAYPLRAAAYDQGHPGGPLPEERLGTLVVSGAPAAADPAGSVAYRLPGPPEPPHLPDPVRTRTIRFKGTILTGPVGFTLNGEVFDARLLRDTLGLGTVEEWLLVNEDVFQHPFHIHVNPFLVTEVNGIPVPEADRVWWDTFALPPRGTARVRMRIRPDVHGATVFHCHILPHEDNGMMAAILLGDGRGAP
jgi:FtsP/CotA-like multicopper oxidase with cupredoxin domain